MNAAGYARKSPRRPLLFAHRFADGKASRGDAKVPLRLRLPHFPTLSEREDTSPGFVSSSIALQAAKRPVPFCCTPHDSPSRKGLLRLRLPHPPLLSGPRSAMPRILCGSNDQKRTVTAMNVREIAYLTLLRAASAEQYSNLALDSAIRKYHLTGADRAFFTQLIYGTIEREISLDWYIRCFSSVKQEKIEPGVMILLRMGIFQLLFLDRIPDSAAVNETVSLAKTHLHKGVSGFINAVLRSIARSKSSLPMPEEGTAEYRSVRYSCPVWLCRLWADSYGEERAERLLAETLKHPLPTLRVNTLRITRRDLLAQLQAEGVACTPTQFSENGIQLSENLPISEFNALQNGLCFIQDEASQLCAEALQAEPGLRVLDACACPGGKSFSCAISMENRGTVIAADLHESKLSLVERGAARLGITSLTAAVQDASKLREEWIGSFDRVLCDVPCSGLGVLAKKPDLRRKKPEDIARLPELQYKILCRNAEYVKPGGLLVYSTCTLHPAENEENTVRFLREHPDFVPCADRMPKALASVTLFPDEFGTDGFFLAKFTRIR